MELLQIISVLCKSEKNNPVLVGDAGVGKTAIVEGLAQLIARGNVPPQLQGKRIRTVEVANIVAGTGVRGQLEEKLQALIKEARDDPSLILFIDEIHMLVGAGATGLHDTMDAANILKPALSRGEITVIGATTYDEYRKNIEKDPALERRFAMVRVPEPTADDALEILAGLRSRYEEFHNVRIADDALRAAVELSIRYVTDRRLPDKALELIDRSCAETPHARVARPRRPRPERPRARGTAHAVRADRRARRPRRRADDRPPTRSRWRSRAGAASPSAR